MSHRPWCQPTHNAFCVQMVIVRSDRPAGIPAMWRVPLGHTPPSCIRPGCWYFVTICCQIRGVDQLCRPETSAALLADAVGYHVQRKWVIHLFLLMPDHLHAVVAFPSDARISTTVGYWKRLETRRVGIAWRRNFFDHRLRPGESLRLKSEYIRQNPVRAGLVARAVDWPHFVDFRSLPDR
jgi:putative transposase